jgi:hypothetical protein
VKPVLWRHLESVDTAEIAAILQDWRAQRPGLGILALASEHAPTAVSALQQAANQAALPLAGAVVPGLVVAAGLHRPGVLLLALDATTPQRIVPLRRGGKRTDDAAVAELAAGREPPTPRRRDPPPRARRRR